MAFHYFDENTEYCLHLHLCPTQERVYCPIILKFTYYKLWIFYFHVWFLSFKNPTSLTVILLCWFLCNLSCQNTFEYSFTLLTKPVCVSLQWTFPNFPHSLFQYFINSSSRNSSMRLQKKKIIQCIFSEKRYRLSILLSKINCQIHLMIIT